MASSLIGRAVQMSFAMAWNGWEDLFTPRQLAALTTFSDLLLEVWKRVLDDARSAGISDDSRPLRDGGSGATAYADAVLTYLAFAVDKCADYWSTICIWHNSREQISHTFGPPGDSDDVGLRGVQPFLILLPETGWQWSNGSVRRLSTYRLQFRELQCSAMLGPPFGSMPELRYRPIHPTTTTSLTLTSRTSSLYGCAGILGNTWPDECATLLTPKAAS